jgi:hypothetical protein
LSRAAESVHHGDYNVRPMVSPKPRPKRPPKARKRAAAKRPAIRLREIVPAGEVRARIFSPPRSRVTSPASSRSSS